MAETIFFLRISNTDHLGEVEIIGGPASALLPLIIVAKKSYPRAVFEDISEEEAYKELLGDKIGTGIYISNPFDIRDNESRRRKAANNLLYLTQRLGCGAMYEPIELKNRHHVDDLLRIIDKIPKNT